VQSMEKVGGGQLTRRQHLLSRDGRLLIVCLANNLRVYSAVTGEMLFELEGHTDEVTALSLDPLSPAQVRAAFLCKPARFVRRGKCSDMHACMSHQTPYFSFNKIIIISDMNVNSVR
jgi:hypothetical protein